MNLLSKKILFIPLIASFLLSIRFLFHSFDFLRIGGEDFDRNIVMTFSNLAITLVIAFIYDSKVTQKSKELMKKKFFSAILFIYNVFIFCVFAYGLIEFGFSRGENLFYQFLTMAFAVFLFSYLYKSIRRTI